MTQFGNEGCVDVAQVGVEVRTVLTHTSPHQNATVTAAPADKSHRILDTFLACQLMQPAYFRRCFRIGRVGFATDNNGNTAQTATCAITLTDIVQFVAVLLQFLFFATPIMYPLTMIPADLGGNVVDVRELLGASPLANSSRRST